MVKLKLTHFSDGCAVAVAIQHLLVDGQRYVEVCRDLSRAYRGIEIPERDLDRSYLWPDQLAKFFPFLGEDVANLPRKVMPSGDDFKHLQFPDDTGETHVLRFSQARTSAAIHALMHPVGDAGQDERHDKALLEGRGVCVHQ